MGAVPGVVPAAGGRLDPSIVCTSSVHATIGTWKPSVITVPQAEQLLGAAVPGDELGHARAQVAW